MIPHPDRLLLSALVGAVVLGLVLFDAYCRPQTVTLVEATPTLRVSTTTPAPTLTTLEAGPPTTRTPVPVPTEGLLARPTATTIPMVTATPTAPPEPPTATPVRTMVQRG